VANGEIADNTPQAVSCMPAVTVVRVCAQPIDIKNFLKQIISTKELLIFDHV
jgi:hypothetical protein